MADVVIAGIIDGAVYGLLALGIVLVYKATGVINFASGEIGTASVYVAWFVSAETGAQLGQFGPFGITGWGLPIVVACLIAAAFAATLGALMEKLVIRPMGTSPPLTITVATLGVGTILGGLQFVVFGESPQSLPSLIDGQSIQLGGVFLAPGRLLAVATTLAFGTSLYFFFKRSTFGLGVLAASQNPSALRLMGLKLSRVSVFTWSISGVIAAAAGVILVPTIGNFHPFFMTLILIPSFAAALVGGLTSLPGAFVGGVVIGVVSAVSKYFWGDALSGVEFVAQFLLIVGILFLRPNGLLGAKA